MGLLLIWDDLHASGGRSKRARDQLNQQIQDIRFTEHWLIKFGNEIMEKKIDTKHDVLVKGNGLKLKKVMDQVKIDLNFINNK